ncbi:hypothetical protein I4U23_005372, partial [Adineta vaga]
VPEVALKYQLVVKRWLNDVELTPTTVAGNGTPGSAPNQLQEPYGIFVDDNIDLYVADYLNNRIQKFEVGNPAGITKAGNGSSPFTILLLHPTGELTTIKSTTQIIQVKHSTTIKSQNEITSHQTSSTSNRSKNECEIPEIRLIPDSIESSPIQIVRSRDFYILSNIKLNCSKFRSQIKSEWKIENNRNEYKTNLINLIRTDLYIPPFILPYGIYKFTLSIQMISSPTIQSSKSIYIQINPTGITANLVPLGTSMITSGYEQDLQLNPGNYSKDQDDFPFNSTDWIYTYYCRMYGVYDDSINNSSDLQCLSNYEYNGNQFPKESALKIYRNSLKLDETYQFMVQMNNRRNSTIFSLGYVLVQIKDFQRPMIIIGCVISILCSPNLEYQLITSTSQVALYSSCHGNCLSNEIIQWNIYHRSKNSSQWILFPQMNSSLFYGRNTKNFTATNNLFLNNPDEMYWRFVVKYNFTNESSTSALNFKIQTKPSNGSCSIDPRNGTTKTLFEIKCFDWEIKDQIKDYSLYYWLNDPIKRTIIAFSPVSNFTVRLPSGNLNLFIQIRDFMYSTTDFNISSPMSVVSQSINDLFTELSETNDQNYLGQVVSSISQEFNQISNENLDKAMKNGIEQTRISVSSLGQNRTSSNNFISIINQTAMNEFNEELNFQANSRENLTEFIVNLPVMGIDSIKLQLSTLNQLTQTTNKLTRKTLVKISDQCCQLSQILRNLSTKIPFEDVQMISQQLLQCAANALTGVNGVLQQRTNVLQSDFDSSTKIPDDYDTNLESDWSNLKLFIDENDYSIDKINENRNKYYQEKLSNEIMNKVNEIVSLVSQSLDIHLNIGQKMIINTDETFLTFEKISIGQFFNKTFEQVGGAKIQLPSNSTLSFLEKNSTVSLRTTLDRLASYEKNSNTNLSTMISLSILGQNGNEIPFQTTKQNPIRIIIPRDSNIQIPPMIYHNVSSFNSTPHNQTFHYHYVNISSRLPISIHIEFEPLDHNISYLLMYKFDQFTQLNNSDGWNLFCYQKNYLQFIDNQQAIGHQVLIIGLRELNPTEMKNSCANKSFPIPNEPVEFTSDYQLRIYSSGCYYLNEQNQWKSDGLIVGSNTNLYETECFSTHLTKFSSGFLILPKLPDWNFVFNNADFSKNKTIYSTVIIVTIIYIGLMIYARKFDKKDLEKLGVTPLSDNRPSDRYYYQLIVFTGQRKDSGTNSKVHFILYGEENHTRIRTFSDSKRKIFQRGGIDSFVMSLPKSLGLLNYIRIWHDNSGKDSSASWFLKYLIVRDLQTMETCHFIAQRWFGVEKDDGKIERVFPIANEEEKKEFSYILSKKAFHSISDGHLWFSIFSRPPSQQFTRLQRCTCCFVLLFVSMLTNIVYYDLSNQAKVNYNSTISLSFGTFFVTFDQIFIGLMSELVSLIPSIFLIQLFRRLRSRHQRISPFFHQTKSTSTQIKKKNPLTFPWWCIFIAYGISFLLILTSIFFIIARGIEFGDVKSQQWLISVLSSFFSSILLTEPIKIVSMAIFFAFFCQKSTNEDEEAKEYFHENRLVLEKDEEYLYSSSESQSKTRPNRLTPNELVCARQIRLRELQIWSIVREIFVYFCFLLLLSVIFYSNHNSNASLQVQHLRKSFQIKIYSINEYWKWLEDDFILKLRAQKWYNGKNVEYLRGYLNDTSNRLIGWPFMKQSRIRITSCSKRIKIKSICRNNAEEKRSFLPGWIEYSTETFSSSISQSFQYKSNDHGYVYEFRSSLKDLRTDLFQLHQFGWIDQQTRLVQIHMSLYNPNVQLFTFVTLRTEFFSTGSIHFHSRFEPIDFYDIGKVFHKSQGDIYVDLRESVYLNDLLTYFNGFCCFFGTIKFLHLCRFNHRLSLFTETLRLSTKELISFSMMFSIIFTSFLCLFYLLFLSKLNSCSTLFQTCQMLFEMILLKFDANQLSKAGTFLGPFTLILFVLIVVFICLSMFLSIISDNFHFARQKVIRDPEVFSFMINKFLQWTGLRKRPQWEIHEEEDQKLRGEYLSSIDTLTLRINQLVNQINRMYSNHQTRS